MTNIQVEDALKHPNWAMGRKITIDSSTIEGKLLISHNGLFINGVEVDKNETIIDNYDISLQQNRLELIDSLKKIENKCEEEISMQIKSQPLKRILKK